MVSNVADVESPSAGYWIASAVAAFALSALAAYLLHNPVRLNAHALERAALLPASLYFDAPDVLDGEHSESIVAIAAAARINPTPVVVTAYADPAGNRQRNLGIARKRAAGVRDALVTAGVPTLRVVLVSPAFASTSGEPRVEVSAVQGVRAFPVQRRETAAP